MNLYIVEYFSRSKIDGVPRESGEMIIVAETRERSEEILLSIIDPENKNGYRIRSTRQDLQIEGVITRYKTYCDGSEADY